MVVKPRPTTKSTTEVFESRVILDGSQTERFNVESLVSV